MAPTGMALAVSAGPGGRPVDADIDGAPDGVTGVPDGATGDGDGDGAGDAGCDAGRGGVATRSAAPARGLP
ncbi:hypothetical protein ND747_28495, partial [Frankia sp. R82]|nr:hypothetical protein [Frankia sp. R82]